MRFGSGLVAKLAMGAGCALLAFSCGSGYAEKGAAPENHGVLVSPLAGRWYPADAKVLRRMLGEYIEKASPTNAGDVVALILPHAGYRYSGATAAWGVKMVAGRKFSRVVVMGPTHHFSMPGAASVPDVAAYVTPLGEVPLDTEMIARLRKHPEFVSRREVHAAEHSVQIEVPLLQMVLGKFNLVPIVAGQFDIAGARRLAKIILSCMDEKTLVVASSDFTHYGPNYGYVPFTENVAESLRRLDMGAFAFIRALDGTGLLEYVRRTGATICGRSPIAVLLEMLPRDATAHLLHYDTSGREMGDFRNSVSYLAVAFSGKWRIETAARKREEEKPVKLSDDEKKALLRLARGTITYYMENGRKPDVADLGITITPAMRAVMGAFVTLHENGQLRGCIGEIFPRRALYQAVMDRAIDAAVHDWRFRPVTKEEVPRLEIEISALTPPHRVGSYRDIVLGRHGIVLYKHGRSAVFLPQVAPEQGWDLATTLEHLSLKAGLDAEAWREGAQFDVFEANVFSEKELGLR